MPAHCHAGRPSPRKAARKACPARPLADGKARRAAEGETTWAGHVASPATVSWWGRPVVPAHPHEGVPRTTVEPFSAGSGMPRGAPQVGNFKSTPQKRTGVSAKSLRSTRSGQGVPVEA